MTVPTAVTSAVTTAVTAVTTAVTTVTRGLALSVGWLTVVPVRTPAVDRRQAAAAIRWAPAVGAALGAVAGAVLLGLRWVGVPAAVAALLAVAVLALGTRGMHLDGLADTADGLGCYGPPQRALAVMRDGGAGPFAVVTLVVVVGVQAAALAALPVGWPAVAVLALACALGRAGFAWCVRSGVPAARPDGLGATVAGTQPAGVAVLWWVALAAAGLAAVPGATWAGPAAAAVAAAVAAGLSAHTARRFGGVTGDVLGAAGELGTTAALVVLATAAVSGG